ncbi:MAG TPA: enoyl-CoA hydratase-related protein [Candidatus Acidoferrum sp.]|jgi:2-(1,2-epoxy-1,2-dihydrophenyl)acetyl-CoA isomerase
MSTPAQPAQENSLVLEKIETGVATLVLNRPDRMNALNKDLTIALNEALGRVGSDKTIDAIVITGAGRAFCAGGDLGAIGKGRQQNDTTELEPILRAGMQVVLKIRTMRQPVIAAVNGAAAGAGMNIALAADLRIASEAATFGENFAKVGLFPDYGGTFFLPQLVGPARAAEMFYTGEMIDAPTALRFGIVNSVVPADQLESAAMALAQKIAQGPAVAVRAVKQLLFSSQREALSKALEHEVEEQLKCFHSDDCAEGIRAFMEKRKPQFQGK